MSANALDVETTAAGGIFSTYGCRSAEFARRRHLKLDGISLHSFRYSWAERALASGYPERFAQAALGHKSRAVHQAYAKGGEAICPALEIYEDKLVPFKPESTDSAGPKTAAM